MMRTWRFALGMVVALELLGACACQYDPHPANGELRCSSKGECPDGYTCHFASGTCWTKALELYLGHWTLLAGASVSTTCTDGFVSTDALDGTTLTITQGTVGVSDLNVSWDGLPSSCLAHLSLGSGGAHLAGAGPTCTDTSSDPAQTWTGTKVDVATTTGTTGTHSAAYDRLDTWASGEVVHCTQSVQASLRKP